MVHHQNLGRSLPPAQKSVPHPKPDERRLSQSSVRVETIAPDECVLIHLHQSADEPSESWAGVMLRADSVAIRIESVWSEYNLQRYPEEGQYCIPWHRVDTVKIVAEADAAVQR
jgi:hypothetical protein